VASIVFTLGNASNALLVLKATEVGLAVALIPAIWVLYNIVCTVSSPVFGHLSDRLGRTPVLFAAYGVYYGLSNGILRAYIADLVEPENRATAYGLFNTGVGLALTPASFIFGAIWGSYGSRWAFFVAAGFSLVGFLIFLLSLAFRTRSATPHA